LDLKTGHIVDISGLEEIFGAHDLPRLRKVLGHVLTMNMRDLIDEFRN